MKRMFTALIILLVFSCRERKTNAATANGINDSADTIKKDSTPLAGEGKIIVKASTECAPTNDAAASLGIGIVIAPKQFEVYDDSLLTGKPVVINMFEQQDKLGAYCTLVFNPEYELMHFVCTGQTEKAYQVLVNYSQTKYLPRKKEYEYKSWERYITTAVGINRKTVEKKDATQSTAGFYKAPDETSDTLPLPAGHEMFCPMQVQGDWVKVRYDCFYNDEQNKYEGQPCHNYISKCKDPVTGWLRWRQGNTLMIGIYLMP